MTFWIDVVVFYDDYSDDQMKSTNFGVNLVVHMK